MEAVPNMTHDPDAINDQLILIGGLSGDGKSASLRNIRNQNRWLYLNCEAGKRLPFRNEFANQRISNPYEVHEFMDAAIAEPSCQGVIIDTITFLLNMFESQYIRTAANTQKAWGDFADFVNVLMFEKITVFGRPVIILAHIKDELDEAAMQMKTAVPVKGSLKNNGIEAFFSTVVTAKKVTLKELEGFSSDLLNITEDEQELGFKHVFQTRVTAKTTGSRIRSPMGMFSKNQTYIDNDAQILLDHLDAYYGR